MIKINKNLSNHEQYVLPHADTYKYKLDIGEFLFPHHDEVLNAAQQQIPIHLYPRQNSDLNMLYSNICAKIAKEGFPNATKDNIILTNGSDSALKLLIEAYAIPDTTIFVPIPTYPHFLTFLETCTHSTKIIKQEFNGSQKIVPQGDLCYFANPNLPLGYHLPVAQIEKMLIQFPNTQFIIDEAYIEYMDESVGTSCVSLIDKYPNVVITRTFSKAFGIAGLRLGYIVCAAQTAKLLRVLANNKSITEIAINTANAIFANMGHYNALIKEVQRIKKILRHKLNEIKKIPNAEIYDHGVYNGNFFLIYARDPAKVCAIFKERGIYIRNKHDDVPNAIRICIAPEYCMQEVLNICLEINVANRPIIYDLDQTLRRTSTNKSEKYPVENLLKNPNAHIFTNNGSYTPHEIADYFQQEIPTYRIKTAADFVAQHIRNHISPTSIVKIPVAIVATKSVRNYLYKEALEDVIHEDNENPQYLIMLSDFYLDAQIIAYVCRMLKTATLIYADNSQFTSVENCCELSDLKPQVAKVLKDVIIPDLATYVKMIHNATKCKLEYVGKPNIPKELIPKDVIAVVGDSAQSDGALAKKLNVPWIQILKPDELDA